MTLEPSPTENNELAHFYGKPLIPYHLRGCLTPTGLDLPDALDFGDWQTLGEGLQVAQGKLDWYLGDWLLHGRLHQGSRYMDAVTLTGSALQTLYNKASVAFRVPRERRNPALSFSHHEVVAACSPAEQVRLLALAAENDWTVGELRSQRNLTTDTVARLTGDAEAQGEEVHGFVSPEWIADIGWKLTREQRQAVVREWAEEDGLIVGNESDDDFVL